MSDLERRIQRLEGLLGLSDDLAHHTSVVHRPEGVDLTAWLETVPCACGAIGCPAMTVGMIVPEATAIEDWEALARQFYSDYPVPR
jgi:hypothetical protein